MTFTESDRSTLLNALEVARDKYNENAKTLRALPTDRGIGRLAQQFDLQATQVESLIVRIEAED